MKKLLTLLLALTAILSLMSCSVTSEEIPLQIGGPITEQKNPYEQEGDGEAGTVEVTSEKTAYNPLTGLNNMAQDRVGKRPIAVSVNNINPYAWPQMGLSKADYILEIETEGGITRMMCLFSDTREIRAIGSVRSLRDQFLEALYPLDPIIIHIGTSIYADRAMAQYSYRTIDGGHYPSAIWTDRTRRRDIEHTKFTSGDAIEKAVSSANILTDSTSKISAFNFIGVDDPKIIPGTGTASAIKYNFSTVSSYDGDFRYDEETGKYLKWQFGKKHVDGETDEQLSFDNVIVLFADISIIPGEQKAGLVKVDFYKGGKGYYLSQGHYEEITWTKSDYPSNFVFTKLDGTELQVNVGNTHMGVADVDNLSRLVITP
jgi:hypothetical protein